MLSFTTTLLLASVCGSALGAAVDPDLPGKLRLAPTAVDRINLLDDSQFVFNFFDPTAKATAGKGGRVVTANAATFPAVVATVPRWPSSSTSTATLRTGMITENGARFVMTELAPGGMTIFPQGSIHFQVNEGCSPAMFVAGFNSEDPGALQVAQRLFGLSPDIVAATLGDIGVEAVMGLEALIPDSVSSGTDACLKRCNLSREPQPTLQHQTRVAGNAFPSGVTASAWPTGSAK
ncbi:hypothetical protein DFH09DRAFT_1198766 [Mycena vulgaris]|nr:hypothetical protein DFH09DRAFT_1198766 [Mycena vulgaris]